MSNQINDPFQGQIILFKGTSQYDVLRYFIDDLYEGFRELGHRPLIIDLVEPSAGKRLEEALAKPVFFALGMNGVGMDLKTGNQSIYDALSFPFFAFLVDHPYYHYERLQQKINHLIVSCIDQSQTEYLRKYHEGAFSRVFIPHGGSRQAEPGAWSQRTYDVVFAGTFAAPDYYRKQWLGFDSHLVKLLDDTVEIALYDSTRTLVDILQQLLDDKGLGENPVYLRKLTGVLVALDGFVRQSRRQRLVEALSDYPLHLFGNGWDQIPATRSGKIIMHPAVSFTEIQEIIGQTKVMLTTLPYFIKGGHERIFTSMLGGAVSLSDTNEYLQKQFRDGEELITFELNQINEVSEQLDRLLGDSQRLQSIAEAGKAAVEKNHLWRHRAASIIEAVKFHYTFYPLK